MSGLTFFRVQVFMIIWNVGNAKTCIKWLLLIEIIFFMITVTFYAVPIWNIYKSKGHNAGLPETYSNKSAI